MFPEQPSENGHACAIIMTLVLLTVLSPVVLADRILIIGDSWGWRRQASLKEVIVSKHGHSNVQIIAPPRVLFSNRLASTSGRQNLSELLATFPETTVIHLSIGANELSITPDQVRTQHETDVHNSIINNVDIAIDHIWSIAPNVKIVWTGYDFFRPRSFPAPAESNEIHMRFGQACADYVANKDDRIVYDDLYGTLQVAFGFDGVQHTAFDPSFVIPAGDPSLPDPLWPSPFEAYPSNDAEHPNIAGWAALADAQYESYYGPLLSGTNFQINPGLNDAWFNPATNGQGFLITVLPALQQLFVAWFTFDIIRPAENVETIIGEPGHRWFTAQGPYAGNAASLTIYETQGGVFDAAEPPTQTDGAGIGTMTMEFAGCSEGLVTYELVSQQLSGEIPIQRITGDKLTLCESMANE